MRRTKEKPEKLIFPHNAAKNDSWVYQMYGLYNTAVELGGTIYKVAEDSDFLSAFEYIEAWTNPESNEEVLCPDNMTVVVECFVQLEESDEEEQIFLYSPQGEKEEVLQKAGKRKDGRFLIPEKALKELAEEGFFCLYNRRADGRNGKSFVRYNNAFGEKRRMVKFTFREEKFEYVGDGWNRALLIKTPVEEVFVMPDVFAVEQAVKTYYAERLIRKTINPRFFIERIEEGNKELMPNMEKLIAEIFPEHWLGAYRSGKIAASYKKMIYQICYIRYFYENIYRQVWSEDYKPYVLTAKFPGAANRTGTLGIALGTEESYAVYAEKNGKVRNIPRFLEGEDAENSRYCFPGTGDLCNAGIAYSELALTYKLILQNTEIVSDTAVQKVNVIVAGNTPSRSDITMAIRDRKENADLEKNPKMNLERMADIQLEGRNLDGMDIIREAGNLAGLPDFHAKSRLCMAVARAYNAEEKYRLEEGERALVFYLDNTAFEAGFVEKRDGKLNCMAHTYSSDYPTKEMQEADKCLLEKMKGAVCPTLVTLGISVDDEKNRKAFEAVCADIGRVKRQFSRNDTANILFDNGWLSFTEFLAIDDYRECLVPLYKKCTEIIDELQKRQGIDSVSKLYLAGNRSEDVSLWEYLEEHYQKEVCILGDLEQVTALGAALYEREM